MHINVSFCVNMSAHVGVLCMHISGLMCLPPHLHMYTILCIKFVSKLYIIVYKPLYSDFVSDYEHIYNMYKQHV